MLTNFLLDNKDIFAWKPADMPGVPRELAEHRIDINEGSNPVKQRLRRFSPDKKAAMPLGQITLPVTFGTPSNYRTEFIKFEVVDFDSSYHAILGRSKRAENMLEPADEGS